MIFFHALDLTSDEVLFGFCLDMITPPKENSLIINLFAQNNIFEKACKARQQSCITMDIGVMQ